MFVAISNNAIQIFNVLDDFIEVKIDVTRVCEDELFPAEIFTVRYIIIIIMIDFNWICFHLKSH